MFHEARLQGISYRTAWRWFKAGILPVPANQLPNGTILLSDSGFQSHLERCALIDLMST